MGSQTWKDKLAARAPADWFREIEIYESQLLLKKQGRLDDRLFNETRLRRGVYGQRYDNGQRHDGIKTQTLTYPAEHTKGPGTLWDAPGMQRIKLPLGRVTALQMDVLAEVAEEYSDGILHVTTRQDIQLHFVHIDDTPDLMYRLAAVGITTREACGNSVRNVTACPLAGVCPDEAFDVTPYAYASAFFLLGHKDTQGFGRKFKIAFSGCREHACALANIHDAAAIAVINEAGEQGFAFYVGGGLGAVPHQAKLLEPFVKPVELLPLFQAVSRVFARLGEKENRARARIKFLVAKLGIEEFRRLVSLERTALPFDERWTAFLSALHAHDDQPLSPGKALQEGADAPGFAVWRQSNVVTQKQAGYVVATVRLPLGDLTSRQMRALASLARRFTGDTVCTTVEQNIVFRWLVEADLPAFFQDLKALGLAEPHAGTLGDITSCPGTDTCKLGISSSRGLASELEDHLRPRLPALDGGVQALRIKTSGCFNSCGQHHVADLGFLGVSRNVGGRRVPHFQLVLGGQWRDNGGAYGLAIGAFPAKRIPAVVDRITALWVKERASGETFQAFSKRVGRGRIKEVLEDLARVPAYDQDRSFYSDWGDPREYTIGDMGEGECAGEIVSPFQFGIAAAERDLFEAQLHLDRGAGGQAAAMALVAMLQAAKTLIREQNIDAPEDQDGVLREFRARLCDTKLFYDPFVGDKFAHFLFKAFAEGREVSAELAHQRVEEATLFLEAAHACYDRLAQARVKGAKVG